MGSIQALLDSLWNDYQHLNPQAAAIHRLLESRGETIVNDHIALRTFNEPRVNIEKLSQAFVNFGYEKLGYYTFPEKKLDANHFEHPSGKYPKVFISELRLRDLSTSFQQLVAQLLEQVPDKLISRWDFPACGRPWKLSWSQYETLRAESEYGAWLAAFGFRANHFTVLVNALNTLHTLSQFNEFLKQHGFKLNSAGGEIKGSPAVFLEQSSTLADIVEVDFAGERHCIPACYYEFALRHAMPDGKLYGGFVEKSADKIFESTHRR